MKKILGLVMGLTFSAMLSQAALIPILATSGESVDNPGATTYFYTVSLADDEQLGTPGNDDMLVIYDFFGYVPGSLAIQDGAGSWTGEAVPGTGPYPTGADDLEFGDTEEVNLVFRYTGIPTEGPQDPILSFTADSIYSAQRLGDFQAMDSKNSPNPLEEGTPATNEGNVAVPANPIPEPATLSLMAGALLSLGLLRRRRATK